MWQGPVRARCCCVCQTASKQAVSSRHAQCVAAVDLIWVCRWGWKDVESLDEVVQNYTAAGLPLEVVWSDIEYMPKFWTMEFDPGEGEEWE